MGNPILLQALLLLALPAAPQAPGPQDDPSAASAAPAMMLRLADGGILWGAIVGHDEQTLVYRRLDNGGTVRLPWSLLDPAEEAELRLRFGYVEMGVEEMMIQADRLTLVDGTEIVGLITDRTEREIWVKRAEGRLPVPLGRVAGPSTIVHVPALDIYTKEELYQQKVFELQADLIGEGTAAAAAHFELAEYAEDLFDYVHALSHYEAVLRIDPTFEADRIQPMLARAREKAELQGQVDHIAEIDLWRARRRYAKAVELIQSFTALYPASPLMEDLAKVRERVQKYQERDLRTEVVRRWHYWIQRLARQAARTLGYEEARNYLEGGMGEEVLLKVHGDVVKIAPEAQPDEIRGIWEARKGGKWYRASYGYGTWLLGKEEAQAGIDGKSGDEEAEKDSKDPARKKLEDKIKRYFQNQQALKKAKTQAGTEEDPQVFWKTWPSSNKAQWIQAYYVEHSGEFHLQARFRNCRECGGTGSRHVVFTGSAVAGSAQGDYFVPCPSCHTIQVVRMVRYR